MLNQLTRRMIALYRGEPRRIQHFLKVHSLARLIAISEGLSGDALLTLEAAALVHDIGIQEAERRFGYNNGKLQETYGPPLAEGLLRSLGFSEAVTARVVWLVGHHHTYTNISGLDHRILVEADFLVNLYEDQSDAPAVKSVYEKIFVTKTGKEIFRRMYGGMLQ